MVTLSILGRDYVTADNCFHFLQRKKTEGYSRTMRKYQDVIVQYI